MKRIAIIICIIHIGAVSLLAQDTTHVQALNRNTHYRIDSNCGCHYHPVNNYNGLNSLRARLANPGWDGSLSGIGTGLKLEDGRIGPLSPSSSRKETGPPVTSSGSYAGENAETVNPFLEEMGRGEVPVGAPVLVFFPLAGMHVTDPPQLLNVRAVAELAVAEGLRVRVTGAADSVTGSPEKNGELALARAERVAGMMEERGVPRERIEVLSEGGTSRYGPAQANRNCRIELFVR